ncbi:hypothetical protein CONPUDRAFT_148386 [Coniophora puteana RWD-64-598 SS2]|uniref:Uncharacterized protein n=1 Tax=Coniophora puteana (strain RWD-64-598) TaxID=741705 RepID=A0A5M3N4D8_CONPW|nr:uncharacterized protein CONPUDRAFT_148386 [Coniophora puteana RWD-64-598 SS2]EIW86289.1 hypothetical protein CONPUDRAFT_148386 [Coniophora puteana RWD-64-598 SS2]
MYLRLCDQLKFPHGSVLEQSATEPHYSTTPLPPSEDKLDKHTADHAGLFPTSSNDISHSCSPSEGQSGLSSNKLPRHDMDGTKTLVPKELVEATSLQGIQAAPQSIAKSQNTGNVPFYQFG